MATIAASSSSVAAGELVQGHLDLLRREGGAAETPTRAARSRSSPKRSSVPTASVTPSVTTTSC